VGWDALNGGPHLNPFFQPRHALPPVRRVRASARVNLGYTALRDGRAIRWKPQQRLHQRYRKLLAKGKNKGVVVTAIGRELLGFIWAMGIKVEARQKESLQRAAQSEFVLKSKRKGGSVGSGREVHGKENPRKRYVEGLRTEPTSLVRGSSRRITIMRLRPANIRVINPRENHLDHDLRCLPKAKRRNSCS
jgi:hypothetical protein